MDIKSIKKYWLDKNIQLNTYKPAQLDNPRLLKSTIEFLNECGVPDSCAPGLSFDKCEEKTIPTPNQVFNIDLEDLQEYLMIGNNGSGDPICIDLNVKNEIVYLNHDNYFERVFMNSTVHQLIQSIIRYQEFYASLNPKIENDIFTKRKFSDDEFAQLKEDFIQIDSQSLSENSCWNAELEYLLWERDNE